MLPRKTNFPTMCLDLTKREHVEILLDLIRTESARIAHIHLAPPCGAASMARAKPIPELVSLGLPSPQPLRSKQYPTGLPGLTGVDKERVMAANVLYSASCLIAHVAIGLNIRVSIENPLKSLFWLTDDVADLLNAKPEASPVRFAHCMMGSNRDKQTLWWTSNHDFDSLNLQCDKSHKHASWAPRRHPVSGRIVYATAQEAAYLELLCSRVAHLVLEHSLQVPRPQALYGPSAVATRPVLGKPTKTLQKGVSEFRACDVWGLDAGSLTWIMFWHFIQRGRELSVGN